MGILDALGSARPMEPSRFEAPVDVLKGLHPRRSGEQDAGAGAAGGGGGGAAGGGGAGNGGGQPPSFTQLTLPTDVVSFIGDALADYDMHLDIQQKEPPWGGDPCWLHVAVNGGFSISLLHLEAQLLGEPTYKDAIGSLWWLFQPEEKVRVVSKECQNLHPTFRLMWRGWTQRGVETEYAEWADVSSLQALKGTQRAGMVSVAFRFPQNVKPLAAPRVASDLMQDSGRISTLVTIMAEMGRNSGSVTVNAWINGLLAAGGLPTQLRDERVEWGNNYPTASRAMIEWLLAKGRDPDRKGYFYLATVLEPWTEGIGADKKAQVLEILSRFQLRPNEQPPAAGG